MGEGWKRLKSERGGKRGRGHVREVRIRGGQCCLIFTCFSFSLPLSADVCLSVRVYRRITLCKHWAFALNRQHRYSQLMFSLSGAPPANRTLYRGATGNAAGHSFIMARLHCAHVRVHAHITMGLNCTWPPSHFLPFKSCFWEGAAAVRSEPPPQPAAGWGSDPTRHGLVPNIQGTITSAKNILVNSVICVLKVRENAAGAKMYCSYLPACVAFHLFSSSFLLLFTDPDLWPPCCFFKVTSRSQTSLHRLKVPLWTSAAEL